MYAHNLLLASVHGHKAVCESDLAAQESRLVLHAQRGMHANTVAFQKEEVHAPAVVLFA